MRDNIDRRATMSDDQIMNASYNARNEVVLRTILHNQVRYYIVTT